MPGRSVGQPNFPHFQISTYGAETLKQFDYQPHDPDGYLRQLQARVSIDSTALAYVTESLQTFSRGNFVASMVMLGVAAERVFLLTCQSLVPALKDPQDQAALQNRMNGRAIKATFDWVHQRLQRLEALPRKALPDLPESLTLMLLGIYDCIRVQRNDLGHPRELPPKVDRAHAFARLHVFPTYYEASDRFRTFLGSHPGEL